MRVTLSRKWHHYLLKKHSWLVQTAVVDLAVDLQHFESFGHRWAAEMGAVAAVRHFLAWDFVE
jgi:hypothetical protein